jgi:hypothetical protein
MPFQKVGSDDYQSPSGRHFNGAQVRLWYANGEKFPGQKQSEGSMSKSRSHETASYAAGGLVRAEGFSKFYKTPNGSEKTQFGKKVNFMAAKNEFTDSDIPDADEDNKYAKSGEGEGKGCYTPPPAAGKTLTPVKPH